MNTSQFYMTLPSNSSSKYFLNNDPAHYTTQLARRIDLMGLWEVALVEIHYPGNFENVTQEGNTVSVESDGVWSTSVIRTGAYNDINTLLQQINVGVGVAGLFTYDKSTSLISFHLFNDSIKATTKIRLPDSLMLQLGYEPGVNIMESPNASKQPDVMKGVPNNMFVYCDIVEPQLLGDVMASVLRVVNTRSDKLQYGRSFTQIFQAPMYVPVLKRQFNSIEINLRDSTGYYIPFAFGLSSVVLHFKRCPE